MVTPFIEQPPARGRPTGRGSWWAGGRLSLSSLPLLPPQHSPNENKLVRCAHSQ